MIAFDLQCSNGHAFEGWFDDSETYAKQLKKGLVSCPVCNDLNITQKPSTFAIKSSTQSKIKPEELTNPAVLERQIRHYVEKNFEDVGCDFAKEALKIHYGVSEERNIRGISTKDEEETLRTEGVPFLKFPSSKKTKEDE